MAKKTVLFLIAATLLAATSVFLYRGCQGRQVKDRLQVVFSNLPGVESWSCDKAEKDEFGNLKLSKLKIKLAGRADPLTLDGLELAGFNEDSLAGALSPANWREQPETALADRLIITNMVIPIKRVGGLKITRAEGLGLKLAAAGADNPEGPAGFLAGLQADQITIGLMEMPAVQQPPPAARVTLQAVEAKGIADSRIESYKMTGLDFSDLTAGSDIPISQLKIGQVEARQTSYQLAVEALSQGSAYLKTPASDQGLWFLLAPVIGLEEFSVRDIIYLVGGKPKLTWAEFKLRGPIKPGEMPPLVTVTALDLVILATPTHLNPKVQVALTAAVNALGYNALTVANFEQERAYDAEARTYRESYKNIDVKNAFKLDFFFELSDFDPQEILTTSRKSLSSPFITFAELPLREVHLKLVDDSLAERLYKLAAVDRGQTVEETKQSMIDSLRGGDSRQAFATLINGGRLLKELSAFIKAPKTLEISLKPSGSVSSKELKEIISEGEPTSFNQLNLAVAFNGGEAIMVKKKK